MIRWQDRAVILGARSHGESSAIIDLLTESHGRYSGVVKGGASRKQRPHLQAGQLVITDYSARLEEHMGGFQIETSESFAAALIADARKLAIFQAIAAMTKFGMIERDPHPALFRATLNWLRADNAIDEYVRWECVLLSEAGFHLELDRCAVSGARAELTYVSPKTGRAISKSAAGEWADRLLPYSPIFAGETGNAKDALTTTGYFLTHWLGDMVGKAELPKARARLLDLL